MALKPAGKFLTVVSELAEGWRAATLVLFLFVLLLVVCGLPFATADLNRVISHRAGPCLFLACAVYYAGRSARAASPGPERRFWYKLATAYGVWTITYVPSVLAHFVGDIDAIRSYLDIGWCLAYGLVVAAFEERPDDRSPITELGRRPSLWQALLLMAAFYSTVVLLPSFLNPGQASTYLSSFGFWVFMDLAIAARIFYFCVQTAGRRWRFIYGMVGGAFVLMMVVDLLTAYLRRDHISVTSGHFYDAFWTLPYGLLLLAAAVGLIHFEDRRGREREPTLSDAFAASSLIWALFFPGFHFAADQTGWLDPSLRPQRDLLVVAWTLVLMVLAIVRQRQIERNLAGLVHERREMEGTLRESEQDLRLLVERTRVADRLKASEERFAKAFEVSPDALVLSTFADGTILDVNPAFERLSLLSRAACIGRRALDLGLWPHPEGRERLLQLLQRRRQMHDLPGELHRADGRVRAIRASYERITEGESDYLLSVLRDSGMGEGTRIERVASLLENTRIPLRLVREATPGGDSTAIFANAGARLALRGDRADDIEVSAGSGLRLLLHLKDAESELP